MKWADPEFNGRVPARCLVAAFGPEGPFPGLTWAAVQSIDCERVFDRFRAAVKEHRPEWWPGSLVAVDLDLSSSSWRIYWSHSALAKEVAGVVALVPGTGP